jgi:hypothetical protein
MSTDFTPSEIWAYYAPLLGNLQRGGQREYRGPCPVHKGCHNNFAIDIETGLCYCFSKCNRGWDIFGLDQALFGGDLKTACKRVFAAAGRQWDEPAAAEWARTAEQRKQDQIDEPMAICWCRGLLQQIEMELTKNKRFLFVGGESQAAEILVRKDSERQQQLVGYSRSELLAEFRAKRREQPEAAAHWVRVGAEDLEDCRMICVAIVRLIEMSASQFPTYGVKKLGGSKE